MGCGGSAQKYSNPKYAAFSDEFSALELSQSELDK